MEKSEELEKSAEREKENRRRDKHRVKKVREKKNKMIKKCIGTGSGKKVTIPLKKVGTAKNFRYEIIKEKKKKKPEDQNRQKAINFEHKRNVIPSY